MHPEICRGLRPPPAVQLTLVKPPARRSHLLVRRAAQGAFGLATLLAALQAAACEQPVFACDMAVSVKQVMVCEADGHIHYRYGPRGGTPELELRKPRAQVQVTPWNGMGSTYWSSMDIPNGAWSYRLSVSYERGPSEAPPKAGITVLKNGQTVRELACNPSTLQERIESLMP